MMPNNDEVYDEAYYHNEWKNFYEASGHRCCPVCFKKEFSSRIKDEEGKPISLKATVRGWCIADDSMLNLSIEWEFRCENLELKCPGRWVETFWFQSLQQIK